MANYRPGNVVKESGLYHASRTCPACPQKVWLIRGERFPACNECSGPEYELAMAIEPIENDPDFR